MIIDFRISVAQVGEVFSILATNVVNPSYTVTGLTAGLTYQFKVQSRNSYGLSGYSEKIRLLCAYKPDAPVLVTSINSGDQVTISWSAPVENGSPITAYKIFIRQSDSLTYT